MALYFECRIKNALLQTVFFCDFAHWDSRAIRNMKNAFTLPAHRFFFFFIILFYDFSLIIFFFRFFLEYG